MKGAYSRPFKPVNNHRSLLGVGGHQAGCISEYPVSRTPALPPSGPSALPRHVRADHHQATLAVTDSLADTRFGCGLLVDVENHLCQRLIAILAGYGCGKTGLAEQTAAHAGAAVGMTL